MTSLVPRRSNVRKRPALLDKSRNRQYVLAYCAEGHLFVENMADVRLKRAEQDIETLRSTQSAVLERFDEIYRTMKETRDIAAENRERLERVEERLDRIEELSLENRAVLFAIADHLDLTLQTPPHDPQPD